MNGFAVYRHRRGLSQIIAADMLGVDHSTVAKWETGKSFPRGGLLLKIAELYGCSVDELLCDEDIKGGIGSGQGQEQERGKSGDPYHT